MSKYEFIEKKLTRENLIESIQKLNEINDKSYDNFSKILTNSIITDNGVEADAFKLKNDDIFNIVKLKVHEFWCNFIKSYNFVQKK